MAKVRKTKAERRIIILKDALKQLKLNKIIASTGDVVESLTDELIFKEDGFFSEDTIKDPTAQVKPVLEKLFKNSKKPVCKVCARGALLISTIHKENSFNQEQFCDISGSNFNENSSEDSRLLKLFSKKQLLLMENAFETRSYYDREDLESLLDDEDSDTRVGLNGYELTKKEDFKSYMFGKKYNDPNDRLMAIIKNAIRNNGLFKP